MNRIFLLILASITLACGTTKKVVDNADSLVFTLRKTACRGKCPVYYMEVYKSGRVVYEGKENIEKTGKYEKQIKKKVVQALIQDFKTADFFNFKDEYTAMIRDLPSTYVGFTHEGKTKMVRDYRDAPKELIELEKKLETIANSSGWKKIE